MTSTPDFFGIRTTSAKDPARAIYMTPLLRILTLNSVIPAWQQFVC
jgi:hypothetical protein